MKKIFALVFFLLVTTILTAQETEDYQLVPGATATVNKGASFNLSIIRIDKNAHLQLGDLQNSEVWTINGHDLLHLTATDGKLKTDGLNFSKATYTAPTTIPEKNPVIIQVRFPTKPGGKEVTILQCAVTITDAYKISGDIILTSSITGMDIKLHIEEYVNYTPLSNGAAMLDPVNGKGTLHVKVENGIMVNKNGALGKYQSPMEFDMPVLISIDKQGDKPGPATFYFKSFSSPDNNETYLLTSGSASQKITQNYINQTVLNVFNQEAFTAAKQNISSGYQTIDWANRMKAIQNKKPNQLTAQDKKDIAQMQALKQKMGNNGQSNNPFANVSLLDSEKVGTNYQNGNLNRTTPVMAVGNGAGELNISCHFNPSATTVLELNKEGDDLGNVNHVSIKIKIEKE
ncbi:MAG: hypothetical protein JST17_03440 [Bacteroidetes bacterium]|nr:hypothetical protein [Bacteroidota bacterium]MBS1929462.1 hypothetical protein [Bacteroidota bacterium]